MAGAGGRRGQRRGGCVAAPFASANLLGKLGGGGFGFHTQFVGQQAQMPGGVVDADHLRGQLAPVRKRHLDLVGPGLLMVVWFFIILTSLFLWLHPSWTPYRAMRFYTIGADLIHWLVIAWTLIWWTGVTCLYLRLRHWKTAALIAFTIALALAGLIYALWSAQLVKG